MLTKYQATELIHGQTLHYARQTECIKVRVSGRCQTWKTRPDNFRLPVKYGLYESSAVEQWNAGNYHLTSECPYQESN